MTDNCAMKGFGLPCVKREGYSYNEETGESHQTTDKERLDAIEYTESWWMELYLEKGWTRERVYQEVESWLEDCGWTTKPTRNPCL